ncbi:MAG TPA: M48 family metalloprotease [Dongiaceae bacterium]|nr:M48 family metalloprotease [Dongiaceae bacterium]
MFWRASLPAALAFCVLPLIVAAQQPNSNDEIVDRVVAQERLEVQQLRNYAPLVETYIQYIRPDKELIAVPDGDRYFLGRAKLANGVVLEPLAIETPLKRKASDDWREFLNVGFVPGGFLQMIYVDASGFDRQHYKFDYIRREFLGEVRCLVFDIAPLNKQEKGRFVGRIWVEDRDYHIVRFNGSYGQSFVLSYYFNFDSWRTNTDNGEWLPAFVYTEQGNLHDPQTKKLAFQPFRAQTRLWGYHLARSGEEQEMSKLTIETPMHDTTQPANDLSPLQAQRAFERQAETNVTDHLEWQGLLAPHGEVDQVLETVVNNLEVTNDLDVQPEIRCRVLMTSTLEVFTIGHTIVLSRGLVDVLPDEASLAAILAHELSHVVLAQGLNTEFAFFNSMDYKEKDTFRRFDFARSKEEELAAQTKANELLRKSPYSESSGTARLFLETLKKRSKDFPNLVSPHLGDRIPTDWAVAAAVPSEQTAESPAKKAVTAALPLGGRVKVDPWADRLQFAKSRPEAPMSEAEKMSFEVTPFMLYLTRPNAKPQGVAARVDGGGYQK